MVEPVSPVFVLVVIALMLAVLFVSNLRRRKRGD